MNRTDDRLDLVLEQIHLLRREVDDLRHDLRVEGPAGDAQRGSSAHRGPHAGTSATAALVPPAPPPRPAPQAVSAAHAEPESSPAALPVADGPALLRPRTWATERLLAVGGSLVTLAGAGFLLALAVRTGWFGPAARVSALVLLALVLGWAARRTRPHHPEGAAALAATASAGGFLAVVATTSLYHWIGEIVGLLLALGVGLVGTRVGAAWRSEVLAAVVLVELLVVLPLVTPPTSERGLLLWALFSLAAFGASWPAIRAHGWPRFLRTGVVAVATVLAFVAMLGAAHSNAGAGIALVGSAALAAACVARDEHRLLLPPLGSALVAVQVLPDVLGGSAAVLLAAAAGVTAASRGGRVLVGSAVVLLGVGTLRLAPSEYHALALGLESLALLFLPRTTVIWWGSAGLGAVGALVFLIDAPPQVLLVAGELDAGVAWPVLLAAVTYAGLGIAQFLTADAGPMRPSAEHRRAVALVVGCFGVAVSLVAVAALVAPGDVGFRVAHVVLTATAVAVAVLVLVRVDRRRGVATVLLAAAVAKLLLFDLVAVQGGLRAGLFLVSGVLILAAAVRIRRGVETAP